MRGKALARGGGLPSGPGVRRVHLKARPGTPCPPVAAALIMASAVEVDIHAPPKRACLCAALMCHNPAAHMVTQL